MKKAEEVRELSDEELTEKIGQAQEEMFRLRFRGATQQLEDPSLIKKLRRNVARMKTIQQQRASSSATK